MDEQKQLPAPTPGNGHALTEVALTPDQELQKFLFYGDLSSLNIKQQNEYIFKLAQAMGLNPWSRPFDMLVNANGKLIVYVNKSAAAQLRELRHITLKKVYAGALRLGEGIPSDPSIYEVEIEASLPDPAVEGGFRRLSNVGTIPIESLSGEALSNAIMKCYTKAERRTTLAIAGIAFPDATEVDSIPQRERPQEPQKRTPKPLPPAVRAPEPQAGSQAPSRADLGVVGGETFDKATGEVIEVEVVAPQAAATGNGPGFASVAPPPAQATPASALPSRNRFPPAVAPVGIK